MEWRQFVVSLWLGIFLLGRFTTSLENAGTSSVVDGAPAPGRDLSSSGSQRSSKNWRGSAVRLTNAANPIKQQPHLQQQQQQNSTAAAAAPSPLIQGFSNSAAKTVHSSPNRRLNQLSGAGYKSSNHRRQRRSLAQRGSMQLWDMPGDPTAGDAVLQSINPLLLLLPFTPFSNVYSEPPVGPSDISSGSTNDGTSIRSFNYQGKGSSHLNIEVVFAPVANFNSSLRLPLPPRHFYIALTGSDRARSVHGSCGGAYVYKDQTISCPGLVAGEYTVAMFDKDDDNLQLADRTITVIESQTTTERISVELGMLQLEASFGSLAWAGQHYPQRKTDDGPVAIHAQIVGAQIVVYTRAQPDLIWDMQWTGDEGTANFFILPGSQEFVANMSVGDTLLASMPVSFSPSAIAPLLETGPQVLQLKAEPQLLCTGEVEDVRGESGQFPANITAENGSQPLIYHPRGFFCRWELLPDYPELTLTVSYANLLEEESITLYLGPKNVVRLQRPKDSTAGGIFQTSVWVDRSIFVEFQTTRKSTAQVGTFSVSWSSSSPGSKSLMDSRTMVVVLACVSAAGAVLAAFCFYCLCCGRRRRGAVVVDGAAAAQHVSLLRVPSAVRELLPSKPYQPPEADNPLPGAATEPDCCSICLVEFEAQENVTVLPCMHFYHKDCIDSWLKRNCTCPLCKANVLQAFTHATELQHRRHRRSRRQRRQQHQAATTDGTTAANHTGISTSNSGSSDNLSGSNSPGAVGTDASAVAAATAAGTTWPTAAEIEMTNAHDLHSSAAMPDVPGDAVVDVRALSRSPVNSNSRLPTLQHPVAPSAPSAAAGVATPKSLRHSGDGHLQVPGDSNGVSQQLSSTGQPAGNPMYGVAMSPAASLGLQSGTVHALPSDFAAAAAAAAAALASAANGAAVAGTDLEGTANATAAGSPGAGLGGQSAYNASLPSAAQTSVAALRVPSRVWGQLHGWLRGSNGSIPDESAIVPAAVTGAVAASNASMSQQYHLIEVPANAGNNITGHAAAAGVARGGSSSRTSMRTPELLPSPVLPGRVAVSIYAYAGHPQPSDGVQEPEDVTVIDIGQAVHHQLQQHGRQHGELQQQQEQCSTGSHGLAIQAAGSSAATDQSVQRPNCRCSLPGSTQQQAEPCSVYQHNSVPA